MEQGIRTLAGCLLEALVVDFCIVVGLAGQKMAVMKIIERNRYEMSRHNHRSSPWYSVISEDDQSPMSEIQTVTTDDILHENNEENEFVNDTPIPVFSELLRDVGWMVAFGIFILGNLLEMYALSLTSQTNIALMSNFTLIWNAIVSVVIFHEKFNVYPVFRGWKIFQQWDAFHCLILTTGSLMAVFAASFNESTSIQTAKEELRMLLRSPFCFFALFLTITMMVVSLVLVKNWRNLKTGNLNAALIGALCAFLSAFAVTLSKAVTNILSESFSGSNQYNQPEAWILTIIWVFLLISQLVLLNVALGSFEQGIIVPIYEILGTITTLCSGILYFQTYDDFSRRNAFLFFLGSLMMIWGVWLVAHREVRTQQELSSGLHRNMSSMAEFLSNASLSRLRGSPTFDQWHRPEDDLIVPRTGGSAATRSDMDIDQMNMYFHLDDD